VLRSGLFAAASRATTFSHLAAGTARCARDFLEPGWRSKFPLAAGPVIPEPGAPATATLAALLGYLSFSLGLSPVAGTPERSPI